MTATIAANMYGAVNALLNSALPRDDMYIGDKNCPRYKLAEMSGITVVAAVFPPLIDAMVLR